MNKYRVERSIKITVVDYIVASDTSELAAKLEKGPSLAGEISSLGLANIHQNVSYTQFNESIVEAEVNVMKD